MAEETLRRDLDRAFDPGPDFPNRLLVSRAMSAVSAYVNAGGAMRRSPGRESSSRIVSIGLRLVAAAIMALIALGTVGAFLALHRSVPEPVQNTGPKLLTIPTYNVVEPGTPACSYCAVGTPVFISKNTAWISEQAIGDSSNGANQTTVFRTDDGGFHWKGQVSWRGDVAQIIATPDGREVTVVGSTDTPGSGVLHTTDGGVHWTTLAYPPTTGHAAQTMCKNQNCHLTSLPAQVYFTSVREGWVLSQEATYSVADLFHTTDSGSHWDLTRIDTGTAFGVDLVQGSAGPNGPPDHALHGQLLFGNSSTGWFVADNRLDVFVTHDGGRTWRKHTLPMPIGIPGDLATVNLSNSARLFSDGLNGVVSVYAQWPAASPGGFGYQTSPFQFEYATSDGGDTWRSPVHPPSVRLASQGGPPAGTYFVDVTLQFLDPNHWVGWPSPMGWGPRPLVGFIHTSDAGQHWSVSPAPELAFSGPFAYLEPVFGFVDPSVGWAFTSGSGGVGSSISSITFVTAMPLYTTSDGGSTWVPVSLPDVGHG